MRYIFRYEQFGSLIYDTVANEILLNQNIDDFQQNDVYVVEQKENACSEITAPITVFWEVTNMCNSECRHCFNNDKHNNIFDLPLKDMLTIVNEIYENGIFNLKITGGEPFCREDLFDILSYVETKNINFIIYTNGKLINDEHIRLLSQYKRLLCVRVSIDGNQATNDLIRGQRSYYQAFLALEKLSQANINCEINYTITRNNYDQISELIKDIEKRNLKCKINIGLIKISGNSKINDELCFFDEQELYKALEIVRDQIIGSDKVKPYYLLQPIYYELFGNSFGCPAARLTATINSLGIVYPCGLFSGLQAFSCANVVSEGFANAWNHPIMNSFRKLDTCKKCTTCSFYKTSCTGACRANAYHTKKDLSQSDINCAVYKFDFNNL